MGLRIRLVLIALLAAQVGLWWGKGSRADDRKPEDPVAAIEPQRGWQSDIPNPCLSFGMLRRFASWNDPCVLKVDGNYVMYMTTALGAPGQPPVLPLRAVSQDGTRWTLDPATPLLVAGKDPSAFDFQSIETPSVVRFKGRYEMYYTGVSKGLAGPMAIGHATSDDGVHWTKDPNNPVLRPSGIPADFNGLQVAEPGAVVRGDEVYLYFSSVSLRGDGNPPARRVIALAKSSNGSRFGPPKIVLEQGALYPAKQGFDGYSTPSAAIHNGRMHLFYDVGYFHRGAEHAWTQVAIHHAVSDDGETDWVEDRKPIFTRRSFDWTSLEVRSPSPLFEGGVLHLWFAGNAHVAEFLPDVRKSGQTTKFGIGRATRKLDAAFSNQP